MRFDSSDPTTANKKPTADWKMFFLVFSPILLVFFLQILWPWAIVNSLPPWLYAISAIAGAVFGWICIEITKSRRKIELTIGQHVPASIINAVMFLFLPAYIIQALAFVGHNPDTVQREYLIVGTGGVRGPAKLVVSPISDLNSTIRIYSEVNLEAAYSHISTHNRDCIVIETQKGRNGFDRVRSYTLFGDRADWSRIERNCLN